jgi:hypothetical protein
MRSLHLPAFLSRQSAPGNGARAAQPSRQQMETPPQHDVGAAISVQPPISANISAKLSPTLHQQPSSSTITTNTSLGGAFAPLLHSQSLPASQLRVSSPPPVFIRTTSGATISLATPGSFSAGQSSNSLLLLPVHVPPGACPYKQEEIEPSALPTVQPLFVSNDPILADDDIDMLIADAGGAPSLLGSPATKDAAGQKAGPSGVSSPITGIPSPDTSQGGAGGCRSSQ